MSRIKKIYLIIPIIILIAGGIYYYYSTITAPPMVTKPISLKFATFDVGTAWYVLGGITAEIFKEYLPAGSAVEVLPYAGGVANNILVFNRTADIACSFTLTAKLAYEGFSPFKEKMTNLRLIAAPIDIYWFGFAATSYSDVMSFDDIINPKRPIRIGTSTVGGLAEHQFKIVLEAYGLSYDDLKAKGVSIMFAGFPTLIKEAQAKKLDVIAWVVNPGHPSWSELFINPGMRFISLPSKIIDYLKTKYGLKPDKFKAGLFTNSNEADTVMFNTIIIANSDLPDAVAYSLAKALTERKDKLTAGYKAASGVWEPSKWKEFAIIPYHPGAERYYKERFG